MSIRDFSVVFDPTKLREMRERKLISQRQLAKLICGDKSVDWAENTICRWENGKQTPLRESIAMVAAALDIAPQALLSSMTELKEREAMFVQYKKEVEAMRIAAAQRRKALREKKLEGK